MSVILCVSRIQFPSVEYFGIVIIKCFVTEGQSCIHFNWELYLKHSFQTFLFWQLLKETLCRRNFKTLVIRAFQKGKKRICTGQFLFCLLRQRDPVHIFPYCSRDYLSGLFSWYIFSIRFLLRFLITLLWIQYFLGSLLQQLLKAEQRYPNSRKTCIYHTYSSNRFSYHVPLVVLCLFLPYIPCSLIKYVDSSNTVAPSIMFWNSFK